MKHIYNSLALFTGLILLQSCENDLEKSYYSESQAKPAVLENISENIIIDNLKPEEVALSFKWEQANVGYNAAITNNLEMDIALENNFGNNKITLYSNAGKGSEVSLTNKELNDQIIALLKNYADENGNYTLGPTNLQFRVSSSISDSKSPLVSNIVSSLVTPYDNESTGYYAPVITTTEIEDINNDYVKPYEKSNIKEGDRIVEVNDNIITCTADLIENVNNSNGNAVKIKYINSDNIYNTEEVKPAKVSSSQYKLGLWVRDAAAGVGTMTFYEPSTKSFGALGHGIVDIDTGELIDIANGELTTANVMSVVKGEKGNPGEIKGSLNDQNNIGDIAKNTKLGIYGKLTNVAALGVGNEAKIPVALRDEIQEGKAKIICSLDNGNRKEYEIEIQRIFKNNNEDNKSMIIKVTDEELLEKTGGIIQRNEW